MEAVFVPTLGMINQDLTEFPEHRIGLFKLLRAINLNCFPGRWYTRNDRTRRRADCDCPALLTLGPEQFKLFMVC